MPYHKSITPERIEDACMRRFRPAHNPGFCTACGADAEGCEPDAHGYECEHCGEPTVYGAEEFLFGDPTEGEAE